MMGPKDASSMVLIHELPKSLVYQRNITKIMANGTSTSPTLVKKV